MRIKEKRPRKTPADYPQMIFRVNQADKDRLNELIEKVVRLANREVTEEGLKKFRKNDVIVDALFLGLLNLEKKLSKKQPKSHE